MADYIFPDVRYTEPLRRGTLIRRYKRFLADVRLDNGRRLTVHCANSGAMTACCEPGRPVVISDSQNPKRKLRHTWEMIQMGRSWVGVHSARANGIAAQLIAGGRLQELAGYDGLRREVVYGERNRSRVDIVLDSARRPSCYVEVKFSTMRVGRYAAFPDAVTTRGRKHLEDLSRIAAGGERAVILFMIGRNDCQRFRPADEVDSEYGAALREAVGCGVEALAYRLRFTPDRVVLSGAVPIDL